MEVVRPLAYRVINDTLNYGYDEAKNYIRKRTRAPDPVLSKKRYKLHGAVSTVAHGVYTGKLCPPLYGPSGKLKKKPCLVEHREINGVVTDPNVCFVGMGYNYQRIIDKFFEVLMFCICSKGGLDISNYDNEVYGTFSVSYDYYGSSIATATSSRTVNFVTNSSLKTMASALKGDMVAVFGSNVHKIKEFRFFDSANIASAPMCTMSASNIYLEISVKNALLIQNQTLSGESGDSVTAVNANPVILNVHDSTSNIVYEKTRRNIDDLSWQPWVCFNNTYPEVYVRVAANQFTNLPNQISDFFSNAKVSYRRVLQPGEMKKIQSGYTFKGYVNQWFKDFREQIAAAGGGNPIGMRGGQRICSFDKMIDNETAGVAIAYELNSVLTGKYKYKKTTNIVPLYS